MTENIMTIHRENPPAGYYNFYQCDLQGLRKLESEGVREVWYWQGMVYLPSEPRPKSVDTVMANHPV